MGEEIETSEWIGMSFGFLIFGYRELLFFKMGSSGGEWSLGVDLEFIVDLLRLRYEEKR